MKDEPGPITDHSASVIIPMRTVRVDALLCEACQEAVARHVTATFLFVIPSEPIGLRR